LFISVDYFYQSTSNLIFDDIPCIKELFNPIPVGVRLPSGAACATAPYVGQAIILFGCPSIYGNKMWFECGAPVFFSKIWFPDFWLGRLVKRMILEMFFKLTRYVTSGPIHFTTKTNNCNFH
jgi:hypothetical protein